VVLKLRVLIAYLSYSGNTKEVAELLRDAFLSNGASVELHRIGIDPPADPGEYDSFLLGTFTWEMGSIPEEVKEFVLEIGYKPDNIAVFGTGDTQFGGDDLYCRAVDRLVRFYGSRWDGLKIEQSPRGKQEEKVIAWAEGVMNDAKNTRTGENTGAGTPE